MPVICVTNCIMSPRSSLSLLSESSTTEIAKPGHVVFGCDNIHCDNAQQDLGLGDFMLIVHLLVVES